MGTHTFLHLTVTHYVLQTLYPGGNGVMFLTTIKEYTVLTQSYIIWTVREIT